MASQSSNSGGPGPLSTPLSGWIIAHCDGGSRGNPGPAGYGVYVQDGEGTVLAELSHYLGRRTNNFAEYSGLLAALEFAAAKSHPRLRVISDSELMVKQMKGQYRVNSPELRPLYEQARRMANNLEQFEIHHVLREKNHHADRLANLAMDRGTEKASLPASSQLRCKTLPGHEVEAPAGQGTMLRGVVKNGVVRLLEGELPEGLSVKVILA
jgi:ribonuclease HI